MIKGDEPAFGQYPDFMPTGLTIRQHFASMAMQALITENDETPVKFILEQLNLPTDTKYNTKYYFQYIAMGSVIAADALIAELNK